MKPRLMQLRLRSMQSAPVLARLALLAVAGLLNTASAQQAAKPAAPPQQQTQQQQPPQQPPPRQPGDERVVAKVFGRDVTVYELQWLRTMNMQDAARRLRGTALGAAAERYVAEKKLQATPEDIAAFAKWDATFRKVERGDRNQRLQQIETQLKTAGLSPPQRKQLEEEKQLLQAFGAMQDMRQSRPLGPGDEERALRTWIEGHKLRKALYEQYGGRVGITAFGPDPVGATEAWLREHEKAGRIRILDENLAEAFWEAFEREPRELARPEQIDFSYYWLRPVPQFKK
jgi:hypothetical protein